MKFRIQFVTEGLREREYVVGETPVTVGRSHERDIAIPKEDRFRAVSREHLILLVRDSDLLLVNQSTNQTQVDGQDIPKDHKVVLHVGSRVVMSGVVEFCVRGPEEGIPAARSSTVAEDVARPARASRLATRDSDAPVGTSAPKASRTTECGSADSDARSPTAGGGPSAEGETVVNPTVAVSSQELSELLETNRHVRQFKMYLKVGLSLVCFSVLAIVYFALRPHPETMLTYQRTWRGGKSVLDWKEIGMETPFGEKAFTIQCPHDRRMTVKTSNGVSRISTYIGRDREVKLRVLFKCDRNVSHLTMTRDEVFDRKKKALESEGGWNFQSVSPLLFRGSDNGIPILEAQYLRMEKKGGEELQWYGFLLLAMHADCAFWVVREIPASEQWRGANLIARNKMVQFDASIIDGHWEGTPDFRDGDVDAMQAEAAGLLSLRSPLLWRDVEFLLRSVMIKSSLAGRPSGDALQRLTKLRKEQRKEFNRLRALAEQEKTLKRSPGELTAQSTALRIFSSPDDRRHSLLKGGRWE